ncbi:MAG: TonB-dependent receptor [Alphaproteobacteria bacterium]
MSNSHRHRLGAAFCLSAVTMTFPVLNARAEKNVAATVLPEMVVTGTREGEARAETPASVSVLKGNTLESVKPAHPSEVMNRVPGVVVMPTTGEGSIVGIRQPFGTSPVYLYLEDGIPTRATGFFNHNALYEVNLPQAGSIEITRGPGTALQGSDAIGGVVNVLTRAPSARFESSVTAEGGSYGWVRALATVSDSWGDLGARGDLNLTHTDGWRHNTGYDRQSSTLRADLATSGDATLKAVVSVTNIDQQTGANSTLSRSDYDNNPRANNTPIAFRKVEALRASVEWEREDDKALASLTPYVRYNRMQLLPSWQLSYDPVIYTTANASLGLLAKYRRDFEPWRTRLVGGIDLDYSPGFRDENRITTTRSGSVFTGYDISQKLYSYDVTFSQTSPYLHAEISPVPNLRLTSGLRYDALQYDYDNRLDSGAFNSGFGTFSRPASTTRYFSHLSPSVGATYAVLPTLNTFASYKQSFRSPQEGDLFRQGSNLDSIHLKPITVNTYEIGVRGPDKGDLVWEVSMYRMIKQNDILTLNTGVAPTATNNGKTHHTGIEAGVGWRFLPEWRLGANGGYAEHTYKRWVTGTSTDYGGKEIKSAPRVVTNLTLGWEPKAFLAGARVEAEWTHLGKYQEDDANTASYGGHDLFNLRGGYAITDGFELFGRVMNLFDTRWATSAQLSGTQEQLVPGMPRTFYAGGTVRF